MKILIKILLVGILVACHDEESSVESNSSNNNVLKGTIMNVEINHLCESFDPHSLYNNQVFFNLELVNTTNKSVSYKHLIKKIDPYVIGFENDIKTLKLNYDSTLIENKAEGVLNLSPWLTVVESSIHNQSIKPGGKVKLKCRLLSEIKGFSLSDIKSIYQSFLNSDFYISSVSNKPSLIFYKKSSFEIIYKLDNQYISDNNKLLMEKTDNIPDDLPSR